jgi:hypothetical protein
MPGRLGKAKAKIYAVKSGIGLSQFDTSGKPLAPEQQGLITSRTVRVLLAGAGFLADAVSKWIFTRDFYEIISQSV